MSDLGDFLEKFYGLKQTFLSVHARVRHTRQATPPNSTSGRHPGIGRPRRDQKPQSKSVENFEFWARLPDKVRVESTRQKDGQVETTVEIVNGDDTWERFADGTVEKKIGHRGRSGEKHNLPTAFQRHFDRGLLRECFAALTLEAIGSCQVAGRDCIRIRAIRVPGAQLWPHWFSFEANEFELAADVEKAVLLSITGVVDGQPVDTHEVLEVTFDKNIEESLFTYEAKDDEIVQSVTPIIEQITLEAAATRAPFVVLTPSYLPESERLNTDAMYHPVRPGSDEGEKLTVFYRGAQEYSSLWMNQQGEPNVRQQEELEWDELDVDGQRMQISDPHPEEGLRVLVYELEGTHMDIISDLPKDEMIRIALSMTPVSKSITEGDCDA